VKHSAILDASALLATLKRETGYEKVTAILSAACISAVNLTETYSVLCRNGYNDATATRILEALKLSVIPYEREQAMLAGKLYVEGRIFNLSLADCACLALGKIAQLPIYTTDKIWSDLPFGLTVQQLQ
jgi:ribonuclease VapC